MKNNLAIMPKIGTIFLTWRRFQQKCLNPNKITLKQLYVLSQLSKNEYLYPSQIADMCFCDRPTATVIIKNLEKSGWVRREKDNQNARQIKIFLTPDGLKKVNYIQWDDAIKYFDPLSCFTEEEKDQLNGLLNKLSNHLKQIE
jgi:DNA-binding MarR family transcriptional regulator